MRRAALPGLLAIAASLLFSGCALKDPRDSYAYGRLADGLWDADYDLLLDWNFPTSANQGPVVAPKRFRPERPSIGVPWARRPPFELPPPDDKGADAGKAAGAHDAIALRAPATPSAAVGPARAAPADAARNARAASPAPAPALDRLARADVGAVR
jgi:hypothetical protein